MADLSTNFAVVLQSVQSNLNKTLVLAMSDVDVFLAYASQGNFTAVAPSLPDQSNYLYYGFNTYIISKAMQGNNIYAVLGRDTNVQALATNGTQLNYPIDCEAYNDENVCDAWWYSGNLNSSFTLDSFNHMDRNYNQELTALLSNYTTGELLFEGAFACNAEGNYGKPVNITVNAGGVNTACISQLPVLTWNMACGAASISKGPGAVYPHCEFVENFTSQNTFLYGNCHSVTCQQFHSVPAGYLGPLITQTDVKLRRD